MHTVDRLVMRAPASRVFAAAADVERWPALLPHYRWVRMLERRSRGGVVEMAAYRPFGPLNYPTWWVSEMEIDREALVVRYRHLRGITTGMDVEWRLLPQGPHTEVTIVPQIRSAAPNLLVTAFHSLSVRTPSPNSWMLGQASRVTS